MGGVRGSGSEYMERRAVWGVENRDGAGVTRVPQRALVPAMVLITFEQRTTAAAFVAVAIRTSSCYK